MQGETTILSQIRGFGIPKLKTFGYNKEYNILIMELLGPSLENLFQSNNKKFSLKTTCMLGIQMIDRVEYIHSKQFIHRDLKPSNFVIGRGENSHIIYILDFGLAKKYWNTFNKCHISLTKGKQLTGTARYASINALSGCEQSRRDDLESIAYILLYFLRGSLPWQDISDYNREDRFKKICEIKKNTSSKELCEGFPEELQKFVDYVRKLNFTDVPNYDYLRFLLKKILKKKNLDIDYYYDWDKEKPKIDQDNIIYTNNYNIDYNGNNEWLNRNNEINFNNIRGKPFQLNLNNNNNNHTKQVLSINHIPYVKNSKTISELNKIKNHKDKKNSNNNI